jgi:hypothetical protein
LGIAISDAICRRCALRAMGVWGLQEFAQGVLLLQTPFKTHVEALPLGPFTSSGWVNDPLKDGPHGKATSPVCQSLASFHIGCHLSAR